MRHRIIIVVAAALTSFVLAAMPAGAEPATVPLRGGSFTIDDIIHFETEVAASSEYRGFVVSLPRGMEFLSMTFAGEDCRIGSPIPPGPGSRGTCDIFAGASGLARAEFRAVETFVQRDVQAGVVTISEPFPPVYRISVYGPVEASGDFTEQECAVLDALGDGLGLSREQVVVASSRLLVDALVPLSFPGPSTGGATTCRVGVVLPAAQGGALYAYAQFGPYDEDDWATFAGQFIVEVARALVQR